jgi:hypothetical protein
MRLCKGCGRPILVGRDQDWNSDGTITISGDPDTRMGILDQRMLTEMVERIEAVVGPAVQNMFAEGKRRYARHYIDTLLKGPLGFIVRHTKVGAMKAYQQLMETAVALGYGEMKIEVYERGSRIGGTVRKPYFVPFLMGDVRAAFESVERLTSKGTWEAEGEDVTRMMVEKAGEDRLEKRFIFEDKVRRPGDIDYERCKKCGLPKQIDRFEWNIEHGIITDGLSGDRVFIMGFNDINAVFTELEEALGDLVPKTVYEIARKQGFGQVKRGMIEDLDGFARDMALRGMAHVTVARKGKDTRFVLGNPFNKEFMVGRVLGILEGLEGLHRDPEVVKEEPGVLEVLIKKE